MTPMKKKRAIKIICCILVFSFGCCVGKLFNWGYFILDNQISIIDALSLILTLGCAIYIAKVLEKDVQDDRIEKEMFIALVEGIEAPLVEIESNLLNTTYKEVVSLYSKSNRRRHKFFDNIISFNKTEFDVEKLQQSLKINFKQLKPLLTDTAAVPQALPDVDVKRGKITYSPNRLIEIQEVLQNILDDLFKLKIIINRA